MNKKLEIFLLILIVLIASIIRLWSFGKVPISPDWDEVALGYNAYSIIQTGRDEYGEFMPFILRSFDDYKPGLYMYFIIPFIYLFDLSVIAVRLPSAILGILSVIAVYLLVKELFKFSDGRQKRFIFYAKYLPILTAFLFAISPLPIQFSRIAFETNAGAVFNIFGALFFLKGLRKPIYLSVSALFFSTNLYIYQSTKVFTPLFVLAMLIIYFKDILKIRKRFLFSSLIIGILVVSPLIHYSLTNQEAFARAKGVSIFNERTSIKIEEEKKWTDDHVSNNIFGKLFHNKWTTGFREITEGYLSHYDLNWLFIRGDLARHHAPGMSILYFWELPFFLAGIYLLIFAKVSKKTKLLIFSWFFLAPVPASVTSGVPHIVRTLNFLPVFHVFIALGLITFLYWLSQLKVHFLRIKIKYFISLILLSVFALNFLYYLNQYFVQQNYFNSADWQYGYEEAVAEVDNLQKDYKKVIVSNQHPLDQSHMFFLFYLKYPPAKYQVENLSKSGGFREVHNFDKYEFRPIDWKNEDNKSERLYVGGHEDFNKGGSLIKLINFLDGKPAIYIYKQ